MVDLGRSEQVFVSKVFLYIFILEAIRSIWDVEKSSEINSDKVYAQNSSK